MNLREKISYTLRISGDTWQLYARSVSVKNITIWFFNLHHPEHWCYAFLARFQLFSSVEKYLKMLTASYLGRGHIRWQDSHDHKLIERLTHIWQCCNFWSIQLGSSVYHYNEIFTLTTRLFLFCWSTLMLSYLTGCRDDTSRKGDASWPYGPHPEHPYICI